MNQFNEKSTLTRSSGLVTVTVKTATAVYCDTVKLFCSLEEGLMIGLPLFCLLSLFPIFCGQLGAMFDTIQRSTQLSSDWATLLFQLVSSGTITADSLPTKKYVVLFSVIQQLTVLLRSNLQQGWLSLAI